jgi:DHA3 family tetracycline resistance protein-like MFS transporter
LRERDFALLWAGMVVSLLGDGIYFVAIAWQVYDLTSSPGALSLVGLAWSLGMVGFLLLGGVAADRVERRRLMLTADAVRLVCVAAMGVLALTGAVEVWHLAALSLVYGTAEAFFSPAFSSTIPLLVPPGRLVQANALQEVVRPMAFRLAGPRSAGCSSRRSARAARSSSTPPRSPWRSRAWARSAPGRGSRARPRRPPGRRARGHRVGPAPAVVLGVARGGGAVPAVHRRPHRGAPALRRAQRPRRGRGAFGLVLAAGGVGGVAGGLLMGRRGLPARRLRVLFALWTTCTLAVAGYALTSAVWQLMVLTFAYGLCVSCGMVIWATLMQTRVPPELLGRVTSVDWLVSIGLSPLSFALVGPIAALVGTDATLVGAGLLGSAATAAIFLLVPALRADDARSARGPHGGPPRDAAPAGTADARGEPAQV